MKRIFLKSILPVMAFMSYTKISVAESIFSAPFLGSEATQPLAIIMFIVIFLLLFVIAALCRVLIVGTDIYSKRNNPSGGDSNMVKSIILICLSSFAANGVFAQDVEAVAAPTLIGGISLSSFYFLFGIIVLEVAVIFVLLSIFYVLIGKQKVKKVKEGKKIHWIEKINAAPSAKGIADEDISMGHDFDGIEELDNPTPPWWRWGFVLSLVVSIIYLWVYEVAESSPNQYQELAIETEKAEAAVKEFLAKSAANVDENSVKFLDDEANIGAGKAVFIQMCAACHGAEGGGNEVGPNLTDEYWLNGGSIKNIFTTIKYGVQEKGMKSWKDDFSPIQIAQLSSFVKSLKGSSPANAKAPQGSLYTEEENQNIESAAETTKASDTAFTSL